MARTNTKKRNKTHFDEMKGYTIRIEWGNLL